MTERLSNHPSIVTVTDRRGRELRIHLCSALSDADVADLVDMYRRFDAGQRAMGIPPDGTTRIREWLDGLAGLHTIARHDGRAVGHATLVPDGPTERELAVFVVPAYQHAGVGTRLLETLLCYGERAGVKSVWLLVDPDNRTAIALYRKTGFERTGESRFEVEMRLSLPRDGSGDVVSGSMGDPTVRGPFPRSQP